MKVYKSCVFGSYGGGGAIVAANSPEEALQLMFDDMCYYYIVWDYERNMYVPGYNDTTEFEVIEDCVYNGVEPKILFYDIYQG